MFFSCIYRHPFRCVLWVLLSIGGTGPFPDLQNEVLAERALEKDLQLVPADSFDQEETQKILAMAKKRIFMLSHYPALRKVFSDRFHRQHKLTIDTAWDSSKNWMDQHPKQKEELFTAIDPQQDNIPAVLKIIDQLHSRFPDQIIDYWNLAIAVSIVWDEPKRFRDYAMETRLTKSTLPENRSGPIENFEYFIQRERALKGYGQMLPWEFLKHVVNHRTPASERDWALNQYVRQRNGIGKCYSEVPYDYKMLNSNFSQTQLQGKRYTLENIRKFGGVCGQQADYASRVAKSLGIPAEYIFGASSFGSLHAWVMWVELQAVGKGRIKFSLSSHGRYNIDKYYVGTLNDPQTGQLITDRLLELRLHTVGENQVAKRHAELLIDCFGLLVEKQSFTDHEKIEYLMQTVKLCPGNETAWRLIAKQLGGSEKGSRSRRMSRTIITKFFRTFAKMPDFTWAIFDDLIAYETDPKKRIKLYQRLVDVYHHSKRPDLASSAQIVLSKMQVENNRVEQAIEGLASSILLFADDGRSVPKMLSEIEAICAKDKKWAKQLGLFYHRFLPRVPQKRGSSSSGHCKEMYRRGIEVFRKLGDEKSAKYYSDKLAKL